MNTQGGCGGDNNTQESQAGAQENGIWAQGTTISKGILCYKHAGSESQPADTCCHVLSAITAPLPVAPGRSLKCFVGCRGVADDQGVPGCAAQWCCQDRQVLRPPRGGFQRQPPQKLTSLPCTAQTTAKTDGYEDHRTSRIGGQLYTTIRDPSGIHQGSIRDPGSVIIDRLVMSGTHMARQV
jgi:hypothetical protein